MGPIFLKYLMSSGALAASSLAQLLTFALLARTLGPTEFGLFVQVTATTAIAVQICGLGASDSLLRRVSRDADSYPALLGHNLVLIGATGAVLVIAGTLAMSFWVEIHPNPGLNLLAIALLLTGNIVVVRGILLIETIFLSRGHVRQANQAVVGFALARTATAGLASLAATSTLAEWAVWQFCGNLLYAVLGVLWLWQFGAPRFAIVRDELRPGLLYSSQFAGRAVRQNADLFVLGLFAPIEIVGSYGVARRIMDSSYLSVDALNRLVYPRFARASLHGLHNALSDARKVLVAAIALGCTTALVLFLAAPYLPLLFGRDYHDLTFFVRALSGTIVFVAIWSIAIDLLGASGRQGTRAVILNGANILGSGLIAAATWISVPLGTILALYAVEIGIAVAAWFVLLHLARRSREAAEATLVPKTAVPARP